MSTQPIPDYASWYERAYPELGRAGLWLRGRELNALTSEQRVGRDYRVLLTRLSTYDDTGYSFTGQYLYQVAADVPGIDPDLAWLPPASDARIFERDGVPWLLGSQTKRGPQGFDLVAFSNSIVQELVNLPHFLGKSGVPLSKRERLRRPEVPLLLLGGANALYTTSLWTDDPWVDGVFVGESDAAIRRLLEIARDGRRAGLPKAAILERWEEVDGFLQPERPRRTKKAFVPDLAAATALERGPVWAIDEQLGTGHLQISEGCPCFCSFCAESWDRKPYRERRAGVLLEQARRMKAGMGLDSIELYSFNFNMHSDFYRVVWDLVPEFARVGLKSQRFDLLAHDPEMLRFQHAIEKTSLTCGLEGISPRMRRYLHKNLEDQDLHASLAEIFRSRARALKVFLIATGLEEREDFLAFADLLGHMGAVRRSCSSTTRVVVSATPLVRFPWTPLEYEDAHPIERYAPIVARIGQLVEAAGFEFRAAADLPEYWLSQVLVRGADGRIAAALLAAVERTGFVYRREVSEAFRSAFEHELAALGLAEPELLAGHDFEAGEAKPWTRVATGVTREFLWEEVQRARAWREIDYCLGRAWTRAKCFVCGGCPTPQHVRDLVRARQDRPHTAEDFERRVAQRRARELDLGQLVDVGPAGRGVPRRALGVALARALMLADERLVPAYFGYRGSHWAADGTYPVWIEGEDRIVLRFGSEARERLDALFESAAGRAAVDRELGDWGRWLGPAGAEWSPARLTFAAPYPARLDPWLREQGIGGTCLRVDEHSLCWEFGAKARKRDLLRSLRLVRDAEGERVELEPGRRFVLEAFVRGAFVLPQRRDWVRIRVACRPREASPAGAAIP